METVKTILRYGVPVRKGRLRSTYSNPPPTHLPGTTSVRPVMIPRSLATGTVTTLPTLPFSEDKPLSINLLSTSDRVRQAM